MIDFKDDLGKINLEKLRTKEQEDLAQMLSEKYKIPYTDLFLIPVNIDALKKIEEKDARLAHIAPFRISGKTLHIATTTPKDEKTELALKNIRNKGFKVELYIASKRSLEKAWGHYKDLAISKETEVGILEISHEKISEYIEKISSIEDVTHVVGEILKSKKKYQTTELLEALIASALATSASDIHIEPEKDSVHLRFRLDGVLHELLTFEKKIYSLLTSRIKLLSGMKINVHDTAQDGRFSIVLHDSNMEIRSSAIPGAYGESIVLRILNPKTISVGFEDLGIEPKLLGVLEEEIKKPNGMIITTGPTGSGKTTTLYAFLSKINKPEIKTITIENPIEYHLPGITQTQVDKESGYTFAKGLKSILRQDPDVIMVGEIRDNETASTAIHAALTGHLVFSTLHTNDAAGAIPRLVDMDINPKIIGSAISAILAQRLIRKLCEKCKTKSAATNEEKTYIESVLATLPESYKNEVVVGDVFELWRPGKCEKCNSIGYRGRVGIFEAILMDKEIEDITTESPSAREIRDAAKKQGLLTMKQDGVLKILKGITSLEELQRVV